MGQQGYANVHSDCKGLGAAQVAPGSPHEQAAYEVQDGAFMVPRQDPIQLDYSVRLKSPNAIGVLHDASISELWTFDYPKERTYVRVREDGVEAEYPFWCPPFCCSEDCMCQYNVCTHRRIFFHSWMRKSVTSARFCTPYHRCYCIPWLGEVASFAPCDAVNCFMCCCLLYYVPGLANSERFVRAVKAAKSQWEAGKLANDTNLRPTASVHNGAVQMTAPAAQAMSMGGAQMVASAPQTPGGTRSAW